MTTPTLRQIRTRVLSDLAAFANGVTGVVEVALANAIAAVSHGVYGYVDYALRESFPDTARDYFWRWANIYGITQKPAIEWIGTYQFTGTDGTDIDVGYEVQRVDGPAYVTTSGGTISDGVLTLPITASAPGLASNNVDGQVLAASTPQLGVDLEGAVVSTTQSGADVETVPQGLARLLFRLRNPPRGGTATDYIVWALEVAGVTRAWSFPLLEGVNSVSVAFVRDNDGLDAAIIPSGPERTSVLTHLQSVAPAGSIPKVITLTAQNVDFELTSLVPNTTATHNAVKASVRDMLFQKAAPATSITSSDLNIAVAGATGVTSFALAPFSTVTSATNQIQVLGTVTFP